MLLLVSLCSCKVAKCCSAAYQSILGQLAIQDRAAYFQQNCMAEQELPFANLHLLELCASVVVHGKAGLAGVMPKHVVVGSTEIWFQWA
jgi:hypothetical protein